MVQLEKETEMSRLGTCKHCFHIQVMFEVGGQPHDRESRVDLPEEYTCQWLETFKPLPPSIQRRHGGFDIRHDDCDLCTQYEPASAWPSRGTNNE